MEFNLFPLEVKQHIFNYLPIPKMLEMATICKDWNESIAPLVSLRNVVLRLPCGASFASLLTESTRSYKAIEMWIMDTATREDLEELYDLVTVCKDKFKLKKLFLIVNGADKLFAFYTSFLDMFTSLVELHIKFESCDCVEQEENMFELCLPEVEVFSWQESKPCMDFPIPTKLNSVFNVRVPNLNKAKVDFCTKLSYWDQYYGQDQLTSRKYAELGSLVLQDCTKLHSLEVTLADKSLDKLLPTGLESIEKLKLAEASKARLSWNDTFSKLTHIDSLNLQHCHPEVLSAALNHCKTLTTAQIITNDSTGLQEKIFKSWPNLTNSCIVTSKCRFNENIVYRPYLALDHDLGRLVVASDDVVSDESFDLSDYGDDLEEFL
ncbi:predicted protein [Culex quinquefasciatus]|uniref:Predicted protein n=1 Tax=Culex quinquefasciatus TaxID=7176 RepID=B0WZK4_CULQU|nr:predicted protein [Culex quinquefasciatus]|eukprot:XP_001862826.1 predicted protein [Culex quinquefasciatus]